MDIAGPLSVSLPLDYVGPARETWQAIAMHTLSLANRLDSLEHLGADPRDYDPAQSHSLGDFLRRISHDFNAQVQRLRQELRRPVQLVIAIASDAGEPGVLSQLTTSARYGLLDGHALVSVTNQSEIGRWWEERRGLLTRAIVQLDAHAVCLPPAASASCIRNFTESMPVFDEVGYVRYGPAQGARDLQRSDLGKIVLGVPIARFEQRGTPAKEATAAFQLLSERGFNLGRGKPLNQVMAEAMKRLLADNNLRFEKVLSETQLEFCRLIPDNSIYLDDKVLCVEYTWRKGDFVVPGKRAEVAQYILSKLQHYVRKLGWTDA